MKKYFKYLVLSSLFFLFNTALFAAGFQVSEHGADGTGRANSGDAAFADSATTIASNPAGMARLTSASFSIVASYVDPKIDSNLSSSLFYSPYRPTIPLPEDSGSDNNAVQSILVPAAYFVVPINDKFAIGGGVYSNFGLPIQYNDNIGSLIGGHTNLTTLNYNLSLSYRINNKLSIGAGINLIHADATLTRRLPAIPSQISPQLAAMAGKNVVDMHGNGYGYGFNLGLLWELDQNNRFGLSYTSATDVKLKGTFNGIPHQPVPIAYYPNNINTKLTLNLPDYFEFSGYHKVAPQWAIHYSIAYTHWRHFESLSATSRDDYEQQLLIQEEHWQDTWRLSIGTTYNVTDALTLRAGYAYDPSPVKGEAIRTYALPDADRNWFTMGASYQLTPNVSIDLAIAYIKRKDADGTENIAIHDNPLVAINYDFNNSGKAFIYSAQFNYKF